jgi:serralysin
LLLGLNGDPDQAYANFNTDATPDLYDTTFAGSDTFNGTAGDDIMHGAAADDVFVINSAADAIVENVSNGNDTALAFLSYVLDANVENLTLQGTADINGTGNSQNNTITGNSGNNVLTAAGGVDTLIGGAGNDTYVMADGNHVVSDSSGLDTISSTSARDLLNFADIENLILLGSGNVSGTGNNLNNQIFGNSGNNTLSGRGGLDVLIGGDGNDIYILENANDTVVDSAGIDMVTSTVTRSLGDYTSIENLQLFGTANITGIGNDLDNRITGNSGNNTLSGKGGNDTLLGGAGDDYYELQDGSDVVLDLSGNDGITTTISRNLANYSGIENLQLVGTANIDGTGNLLNNRIIGNSGNNVLAGAGGHDTMNGGAGDDTYILEDSVDVVVDPSGKDTITSTVTRSLTSYGGIENLTLEGTANVNANGNAAANAIRGNDGDNTLSGGLGSDTLTGGTGNDVFAFNTAPNNINNRDTITDFLAGGTADVVSLDNAVFTALADGALSSANFRLGPSAGDANDYLIYNQTSGVLSYDADGNGAGAAVQVAVFSNRVALTADDFFVV